MSFSKSRKRSYSSVVESTTNDVGLSSKNLLPFGRVSERVSRVLPDEDAHVQQLGEKVRQDYDTVHHDTRTINTYSQLSFSSNSSEINMRSVYGARTDAQLGLVSSVTASRQQTTKSTSKERTLYPITCLSREELPHPNKLRKKTSSKRKSVSSQWKKEDGVRDHINNLHRKQTHRPVSSLNVESSRIQPSLNVEPLTPVPYQFWTATARKTSPAEPSFSWTQPKTGGHCGIFSSADLLNHSLEAPFFSQQLAAKDPSPHFKSGGLHTGLSAHVNNSRLQTALSAGIRNSTPLSDLSDRVDNHSLHTLSAQTDNTGFPTASPTYSEPLLRHPSLDLQSYQYRYKSQFSYEEEAINIPRVDVYSTKYSDTPTFRYTRRTSEE